MKKENQIKVDGNTVEIGDTKISINEIEDKQETLTSKDVLLVVLCLLPLVIAACAYAIYIINIIGFFNAALFYLCARGIVETVKALLP
jgi:hypothetical protein